MIRVENVETYGFEAAWRGMRNPLNSWDKADSDGDKIGPKDLALAKVLAHNGPVHGKYLRMMTVTMDITAPLYWWKEFDTYKVGTVANSCSTMHKVMAKEFEVSDFSTEHLIGREGTYSPLYACKPKTVLEIVVAELNDARRLYLEEVEHGNAELAKEHWWQVIQLLPSSYNQRRTVQMNYEVVRNILDSRSSHKLDEWQILCAHLRKLPYVEDLFGYIWEDS